MSSWVSDKWSHSAIVNETGVDTEKPVKRWLQESNLHTWIILCSYLFWDLVYYREASVSVGSLETSYFLKDKYIAIPSVTVSRVGPRCPTESSWVDLQGVWLVLNTGAGMSSSWWVPLGQCCTEKLACLHALCHCCDRQVPFCNLAVITYVCCQKSKF